MEWRTKVGRGISDWKVVKHYGSGPYPEDYDIKEMLLDIDNAQPEKEQLGKDYILADAMDPKTLNIGDKVMVYDPESGRGVEVHEVVGFGKEGIYAGYPYTNHYGNPETYKKNPNNYILEPIRVADPNASLTWH